MVQLTGSKKSVKIAEEFRANVLAELEARIGKDTSGMDAGSVEYNRASLSNNIIKKVAGIKSAKFWVDRIDMTAGEIAIQQSANIKV